MSREFQVSFVPAGRTVYVLAGTSLMEAAGRVGIILQASCGSVGVCGKCVVRIAEGECPETETERRTLGAARIAGGYRLACRALVSGPLTVDVPETSLFDPDARILVAARAGDVAQGIRPAVRKTFRQLQPPEHGDCQSDSSRLLQGLHVRRVHLDVLRKLPGLLRASDFAVTVVQGNHDVIAVEAGDTSSRCYGIAFDIGSTTLVGTLVDLRTGNEPAITARMNSQARFGDDVLSRIQCCRDGTEGVNRLRDAVIEDCNEMIGILLSESNIAREYVYRVALAGNTTMQQLLCGIDPSALGELPFVPAFNAALETDAATVGLQLPDATTVFVFPQIGGFVGGDTVAGVMAAGLEKAAGANLLVDIGTNGEIVLAHDGALTATSVAAGPAFEGARITRGMRAAAGAIEKVVMGKDGDLAINVIGNRPAAGLCGSALIDAVAELLRCGVIDMTGRILPPDELPADVPDAMRARVRIASRGEPEVILAHPDEAVDSEAVCLVQKDVRELQLANAAIRTGINILLRRAGLDPGDLSAIMLAGAFGNYIRRRNAVRIGMLPPLPLDHIRFLGNVASLGAKHALLSATATRETRRIRQKTRHVDLSLDPEFQMEFGETMLFPDEDPSQEL